MSNIALQIELSTSAPVNDGANVLFDTVVYLDGNIDYNSSIGIVTFQETGRYVVNWWLATQSAASAGGIAFALSSSQGDFLEGNSPMKTGAVYGVGIIEVVTAPVTISLVNISTGTIFFSSQVPLKGTLVIVQDDEGGGTGPTGPQGDTGPTGPTGPAALAAGMKAEFNTTDVPFPDGAIIPFNTVVNNFSTDISLNTMTGEITLAAPGNYYINWWVSIEGSSTSNPVTFSLELDGASVTQFATALTNIQMINSDLITLTAVPAVLTLRNITGNSIFLSTSDQAPVKASIVILPLNS